MKEDKKIKDLVEFIKEGIEKKWSESEWKNNLNNSFPEWVSIVKNSENWPILESIAKESSDLQEIILNKVGVKLAKRWFELDDFKKGVLYWLGRLTYDNALYLTIEIWKELTEGMKEYLINYIFDNYPGEPFKTYEGLMRDYRILIHDWSDRVSSFLIPFPPTFPPIGYIPSVYVKKLRLIIEKANDKEFLKVVDEMIDERKRACEGRIK